MPVTVTATSGAADATSYVASAAFAAFLERAGVAADTYSDDRQSRALVEATFFLDALLYAGTRASDAQALEWPRVGVPYPGMPGSTLNPTTIPRRLAEATSHLALAILAGADLRSADKFAGYSRAKIGSLDVEFRADREATLTVQKYPIVRDLIAPLLATTTIPNGSGALAAGDPARYYNVRSRR